jgi:hypothetical protein
MSIRPGSLGLKGKSRAQMDQEFEEFREANPQVEAELLKLMAEAQARGRTRVAIGMLFEVLR